MPATTGTRAVGILPIGSWLTCDVALSGTYQSSVQAPNHLQITGFVPATVAVTARPAVGSDAARKRGRPPRGEPR